MIKKQYTLRRGYYYEYTGICSDVDENLTTNEIVGLLNKLSDENEKLKKVMNELSEYLVTALRKIGDYE